MGRVMVRAIRSAIPSRAARPTRSIAHDSRFSSITAPLTSLSAYTMPSDQPVDGTGR